MTVINMQMMRYINLLDRESRVRTKKCFFYNNIIFFAVPKELVSQAIGPNAIYVRKIEENLEKRVKIIKEPDGFNDLQRFIIDIVSPIKFKSIEIKGGEAIITAGNNQNKASLIGRNKRRLEELQQILQDMFKLNLKIV